MIDNLKEREAFESFLLSKYGNVYLQEHVAHYIEHNHVAWISWQGRAALSQAQSCVPADTRRVIELCHKSLAEELSAWDIDPPLHHVKEAHEACSAWLAETQTQADGMQPIDVLTSVWNAMQNSADGDDLLSKLEHMRDSIGLAVDRGAMPSLIKAKHTEVTQSGTEITRLELTDDAKRMLSADVSRIPSIEQDRSARVPDGWAEAYAAFVGAFDTAVSRRKDSSEYAIDARRHLRNFNETMLAAAPQQAEPIMHVRLGVDALEDCDPGDVGAMACYATTGQRTAPQPQPVQKQWQAIESAPMDGRTLLLGYFNSSGKWRTMRGQWMSQDYIEEYWEDPEGVEPGWFETCVEADDIPNCWPTDPTHWMLLPAVPLQATQQKDN